MKPLFFSLLAAIPAILSSTCPATANPLPKNVFRPERFGFGYKNRVIPSGMPNGFPVGIPPPEMKMPSIPTHSEPHPTARMSIKFGETESVDRVDKVDEVDPF